MTRGLRQMGLFINSQSHLDVFNNDANLVEHNQNHSRIDSLTQWMQEQQEENASLNRHIGDLEMLLKQQKKVQSNQLTTIRTRLNELQDNDFQRKQFENKVTKSLARLDDKQQEFHQMLEDEHVVSQEFKEQIAKQILQQEDVQKVFVSRLDNQEGMTEKMVRQLDYLRNILYERTNFLTEKIENSYTMTTSYLVKLLTSSEQPMTRFWMNPKSEEKQKQSD